MTSNLDFAVIGYMSPYPIVTVLLIEKYSMFSIRAHEYFAFAVSSTTLPTTSLATRFVCLRSSKPSKPSPWTAAFFHSDLATFSLM